MIILILLFGVCQALINQDIVEEIRKNNDGLFEVHDAKDNMFKDWTPDELQRLIGAKKDWNIQQVVWDDNFVGLGLNDLPLGWDFYKQFPNCFKGVYDQQSCGSCTCFASTEIFENRVCMKNGTMLTLSQQQVLDCWNDFGCGGAYEINILNKAITIGFIDASLYPYTGWQNICPAKLSTFKHYKCQQGSLKQFNNITQIQYEIMTNGPVVAQFSVWQDFYAYKSGIYRKTSGLYIGEHEVMIVAWGTENGVDYWKVQNSWNKTWGEQGFFRILRGDSTGIDKQVMSCVPV